MYKRTNIGIIDYGTGNIASLFKALKSVDASPYLISNPKELMSCKSLILPGVGHFGEAIKSLKKNEMVNHFKNLHSNNIPILGICLGFQLLTKKSEESPDEEGFGFFSMNTNRLSPVNKNKYKVPHIGWNTLEENNQSLRLLENIDIKDQLFFFCNAYGIIQEDVQSISKSNYSHEDEWVGIAEKNNLFGVQFHPEKSRKQGLTLLNNFVRISSDFLKC